MAIWVSQPYKKDQLFNPQSSLNRDNCLACFQLLKSKIEAMGGQCHTHDFFQEKRIIPDAVLFLDISNEPLSTLLGEWSLTVKRHVILQECEVIIPRNWNENNHLQFNKIFTWNDKLVDSSKYVKLNFPQLFPDSICKEISGKTKLCTMIAGNKKSSHELEIYSKRVEAIHWFEKNHPKDFDLYGIKWDEYRFLGLKTGRALSRIGFPIRLLTPEFPSYRGRVQTKQTVLEKYKFAICYENARDISGYITEKIFDCFFAGCVPVYWGADNITDHIPSNCFIDKRKFKTYEELYDFMIHMNEQDYCGYLNNIDNFLQSEKSQQFTCECFTKTIIDNILE